MLAEHPDVLRRLREEILTKVGSNRRPTYEDIKDMRYLRAVINGSFVFFVKTYVYREIDFLFM
jgi:hypothetical protein